MQAHVELQFGQLLGSFQGGLEQGRLGLGQLHWQALLVLEVRVLEKFIEAASELSVDCQHRHQQPLCHGRAGCPGGEGEGLVLNGLQEFERRVLEPGQAGSHARGGVRVLVVEYHVVEDDPQRPDIRLRPI
jgi:hypothetical protein